MALKFLNDGYFAGKVGIGTPSPTNKLDIRQSTSSGSDVVGVGAISIGSDNPYWTFRGTATSLQDLAFDRSYAGTWYESMRIQRSTGNVGIGTTSPSRLLQLNSSGQTDLHLTSTNQGVGASDGMTIFLDASGTGGLWLREAAALRFATSSSEKMRIDSSGNVGIGTTSPTSGKLVVEKSNASALQNTLISIKNVNSSDQTASQKADIDFYITDSNTNTGVPNARIGIVGSDVSDQDYEAAGRIAFYTTTRSYASPVLTERMRIDELGNVGIGTTNPTAPLHIVSGTSNPYSLKLQSDATGQWQLGVGYPGYYDGQFLLQDASVGDRLRINANGLFTLVAYNSTNQTGTPTYLLGTDASGNIVKTNTVPGSAAGPYLPLTAGASYPLTGDLYMTKATATDNILQIKNSTNNYASVVALIANNDSGAIYNSLHSSTSSGTQHWKINAQGGTGTLRIGADPAAAEDDSKIEFQVDGVENFRINGAEYGSVTESRASGLTALNYVFGLPYVYANSTITWYWNKLGTFTNPGGATKMITEFIAKDDNNYPRYTRGTVMVSFYTGSVSVSCRVNDGHSWTGMEGDVVVTKTGTVYDVWLRVPNVTWSSFVGYRTVLNYGFTTNYTFTTASGNVIGTTPTGTDQTPIVTSNSAYKFLVADLSTPNISYLENDFKIAGTTKFSIRGDRSWFADKVGIGNTNPIHPLYVNGDIGQTDGSRIWFRGSSSSSNTGSQSYIYSNGLNLQIKGDDNVQLLGDGGGVIAHFDYTGAIKFNSYNSTNNTGTPTYLLGTDASGNIVKTNTVPGSAAGPYLPLAGGTMTGTNGVLFPDNFNLKIGTGSDLKLFHNATDSFIINEVGDLKITNGANDKDIIFESDNGSGGTTPYLQLDGSHTQSIAWKDLHFVDGIKAKFGDYASPDLQIYHDGSNSYISDTGTGDLYLLASDNVYFQTYGSGKRWITLNENASVDLFYNDSKKFETTSTGVSVTGAAIVENTSAVTNDSVNVLDLKSLSSGTTANGFGVGLGFFAENSTYSTVNEIGRIEVVETSEVNLNDKMIFYVKDNNTLAERLSITGSGATFAGTVTLSGQATPQIFMQSNTAGTPNWTLVASTNGYFTLGRSGLGNDLYFDPSGNATFAGNVNVNGNATLGNATTDDHIFNGQVTQVTGDALGYKLQRSNGATSMLISASSDAELEFGTDNGSGTNTTQWTIGKDGTDNSFRISNSASLGTSDTLTLTGANATFAGEGSFGGIIDMNSNKITELAPGENNLDAVNYQQLQDAIAGVLVYQGTWNASTNTPTLASGVGTPGYYYIVSVAGGTNLDGITDWLPGDWAIFSDLATDAWQKIDHTNVLNGAGTGGRVAKWSGSGTSYALTDSGISDSSNALAITINGNEEVGIGTPSPFYKLDVNGTFHASGDSAIDGNLTLGSAKLLKFGGNGARIYGDNANNFLTFGTNSLERMRIDSAGNVGIGITSPAGRLHVSDTATLTAVYQKFTNGTTGHTSNDGTTLGIDSDGDFLINNNEAKEIKLYTSDTQRLTISSAGAIKFNSYSSTNNTGTPTYLLGTDASGNVVKTLSTPSPITSQAASLYDLIPNGAFTTTYAFTSTAGVYAEVMESNDVITATGTYSVQVFVSDYPVGGTQYTEYYSGVMSWYAASTNDNGGGAISEISLHRAGHAANTGVIYLRTRETTAPDNVLKLEVMSNKTYTSASNLVFKFVRLI